MERAGRGRGRDRLRDTRRRDPDRSRHTMRDNRGGSPGGGAPRRRTVLKFGGTSVASPAALEKVGEIVKGVEGERVVVVSATAGTTDALVAAARDAERGDAQKAEQQIGELAEAHKNLAADTLGFSSGEVLKEVGDLTERTIALLQSVAILRECTARTRDAIVAYGERVSAPIVAAVLEAKGVKAEALSAEGLVITDDAFGQANPSLEETRARAAKELIPRLAIGVTPVVTGFIGSTPEGVTTTLGRGASDYSAGVLAAAIDASELRIYTDVSGVMSADPRVVKGAKPLGSLSYAEAAEPSDFGLITVQGAGMSGIPGFAARVFDTTAAERVSVMMISQASSENSICLVVDAASTDRLKSALERMFSAELRRHDVERVSIERPVAIVAAVGEGMRGTPGVAARVFGALGKAGVNVVAIAQGSSELNISLVVAEKDREAAVRLIHEEFHR